MDDLEQLESIALRLKYIRDELKPYYKGKMFRSNEIPDYIKEEITKLHSEFGGRHILTKFCNITEDLMRR